MYVAHWIEARSNPTNFDILISSCLIDVCALLERNFTSDMKKEFLSEKKKKERNDRAPIR